MLELDHHCGVFLSSDDPARFHVHTVVRTPNGNDYGRELVRQHAAGPGARGQGGLSPVPECGVPR